MKNKKKNFYNFLKPTWKKIILLIILMIASTLLFSESSACHPKTYGFPLKYLSFQKCYDVSPCVDRIGNRPLIVCNRYPINVLNMIINLILWYSISYLIILSYNKKYKTK